MSSLAMTTADWGFMVGILVLVVFAAFHGGER